MEAGLPPVCLPAAGYRRPSEPTASGWKGYRQAAAEAVGADFIELPLPDPADTPGRAAFAEAVKGRVCFSAQDGTALSAYRLLGEAAKETVLGGFDDFPLFREIGTPAFTFRYQIDTVCRWAMELARSASAEPYLPPVHLAVSAPMLCLPLRPGIPALSIGNRRLTKSSLYFYYTSKFLFCQLFAAAQHGKSFCPVILKTHRATYKLPKTGLPRPVSCGWNG